MSQPNQKVWHLRIAENPRQEGETPYEYYRRMSVKFNSTFENTRGKICKHLKQIRLAEANEKGYIPVIDNEGINYDEVKHGWLKTKPNEKGRSHSLFFKVDHEVDFLDNLIVGLKGYEFTTPTINKNVNLDKVGIINIFDAHIDKLCITDQTNTDSSLESNVTHFKNAFLTLFEQCLLDKVEKILFPIGNDFFNANDPWTWNYGKFIDRTGEKLPGHWRGIYKYYYDCRSLLTPELELRNYSTRYSGTRNLCLEILP